MYSNGNGTSKNPLNMYLQMSNPPQAQQSYGPISPSYGTTQQQQQQNGYSSHNITFQRSGSFDTPQPSQPIYTSHVSSNSFSANGAAPSGSGMTTIGGLLAPATVNSKHSRAISLPAFTQGPFGLPQPTQQAGKGPNYNGFSTGLGLGNGAGFGGFGLAIQGEASLPRWAEEEVHS